MTTRGLRDASRWTVGTHQSRGHTQDTVGHCWKEVLAFMHKRLAFVDHAKHWYRRWCPVIEFVSWCPMELSHSLPLGHGYVTAQTIKHVNKKGLTGYQDDAYWYWLVVSYYRLSKLEQMSAVSKQMQHKALYSRLKAWPCLHMEITWLPKLSSMSARSEHPILTRWWSSLEPIGGSRSFPRLV